MRKAPSEGPPDSLFRRLKGIRCPVCLARHHHVVKVFLMFGTTIRSRRCEHCGSVFSTEEKPLSQLRGKSESERINQGDPAAPESC